MFQSKSSIPLTVVLLIALFIAGLWHLPNLSVAHASNRDPKPTTATLLTPSVGHWPFDDGTSPTSDTSGNGHDGTLVNGPTFTSDIPITLTTGLALSFDGVDDYVSIANTPTLVSSSFTIAFWAKHIATNADDFIWAEEVSGPPNESLHIGFRNDNTFTCAFWNNDLSTTATYTDSNWHHWACTYNASTNQRTIYRDGVAVASDTASDDYIGNGPYLIGQRGSGENFAGSVDELRLYNKTFVAAQIAWLANGSNNAPVAVDDSARMFAVSPFQNLRFEINPVTYALIDDTVHVTMPGFTVTGVNGMAIHPVTGETYAIFKLSGVSGRVLGKLDLETGVGTFIGNLGDNFANLAFTDEGVLYGVTGDGANNPEKLYTIDPETAAKTLYMALGNGADGETIAFNPDDGLMYHSSGNGTPIFESINLNTLTTSPIVGSLGTGEIFSLRYVGNNQFLATDISSSAEYVSTTGVVTDITSGLADDYRGMIYDGSTPYTVNEDTPLVVTASDRYLLLNDFDADFDPLTAVLGTVTAGATVDLNSNGTFTYTPPLDFCGTDTFTYAVNDGLVNSNTATATISVTCLNDAPIAVNDTYTPTEDIPFTASVPGVLSNDYDPDGTAVFTPTLLITPTNGSLQLNGDGSFTYTPTLNFNGVDTFTYQISSTVASFNGYWPFDEGSGLTTADESINNNDGTLNDNTSWITDTPSVISFDDPFALSFDGTGDYVSVPDNNSLDLVGNMTIAMWVKPSNWYNTAQTAFMVKGSGGAQANYYFGHWDSGSHELKLSYYNGGWVDIRDTSGVSYTDGTWYHLAIVMDVSHNQVYFYRNGIFLSQVSNSFDSRPLLSNSSALTIGSYVGSTNASWNGAMDDVRLYPVALSATEIQTLADGGIPDIDTETDTAVVTLNVAPVNDLPVSVGDNYTGTEDIALNIPAPGVLANDSDPVENDPLTAVLDSNTPTGTVTLNSDGSFDYSPPANWSGTTAFTYHADDGTDPANTVTVTLTIAPVQDVPVAVNDTYTTTEDTSLGVTVGVLSNDTDADGDSLTAVLDTSVTSGTLAFNADGSFIYDPDANFCGTDGFTYHANDGQDNSNIATVTLNVTCTNDNPVAVSDTYTATEDTPLSVAIPGVLSNDTDVDGDSLTAVLNTNATSGTLTLNANGSFTYTPDLNFCGTDSFTYHANDSQADSNIVTVTLNVTCVNDLPVVNAGEDVTAVEGETILFSGIYTDPGLLALADTIHWDFGDGSSSNGTLTPSYSYLDNGTFTVTLTITDTDGGVGSDWLVVTVSNANPILGIAIDQNLSVGELFTMTAPYMDPGILDTHTGIIDWGDGVTTPATLGIATFSGSHAYSAAGVYTVTYTITDDDNGTAVQTFTATVTATNTVYTIFLPVAIRN